jgi:prepilin-type N-terminal cleavage/methylation domain-containing protein
LNRDARISTPRRPATRRARPAFSLAEMMIALVVLGIGLLFIAAALPAGIEYSRQSSDLAMGDMAGGEAVESLLLNLRTSKELIDREALSVSPSRVLRVDSIFRPRLGSNPAQANKFNPLEGMPLADLDPARTTSYEPLVKVRPFSLPNIAMNPISGRRYAEIVDDGEAAIRKYLGASFTALEADLDPLAGSAILRRTSLAHRNTATNPNDKECNWLVPSAARVFPPITRNRSENERFAGLTITDFFDPLRPPVDRDLLSGEAVKAADRRVAWTAFYRRVGYTRDAPGADGSLRGPDDVRTSADSQTYEIIVVVTRRPTLNHKYAAQDLSGSVPTVFRRPGALSTTSPDPLLGADRLAPMPWLVYLTPPDSPTIGTPSTGDYCYDPARGMYLVNTTAAPTNGAGLPPRFVFTCEDEVGHLLPRGAILIPARNDYLPTAVIPAPPVPIGLGAANPFTGYAFLPSAPESLPIYEVIDRPDHETIIVKNNGLLPWVNPAAGVNPDNMPFWVIPPPFTERETGGSNQPIFANESAIVAVIRRTVRLPEVTP